ncbi:MAG: ABC transporter substrate-binding protein, partial [Candidatus Eremiobacteraeota bacterium]|nr:ABC transporter substrate-binding protein [Candidatus Eremiobacteraeota bacterium]
MRSTLNRKDFVALGASALTLAAVVPARGASPAALDITVTHYPAQDYALPVVIAQQLGYFAHENIVVNSIVGSEGGGTTVRNIAQGGLKLGQVATPAAIKAILAGEDLRIVGGGVQSAGTISWSVKKDSPIKSIRDFVGKKVGFTNPGSASEALIKMSLTANKIDIASVNLRAAGGLCENLTLLNNGGLDAA